MCSAFERYKQLVLTNNRKPLRLRSDIDYTDAQSTCWELTTTEAATFLIPPELFNALAWAHQRYQEMVGIISEEFSEWRNEERQAFPQFFREERLYSIDDAVGFMVAACGLPSDAATSFVCRAQIQLLRSDLFDNTDAPETPSWAIGEVQWPDAD